MFEEEIGSTSAENEDVNHPFKHRIRMSKLEWARTYILTLILFPMRVCGLIFLVMLSWVISSIVLFGLSEDDITLHPLKGWRKKFKKLASYIGRAAFRCTGFLSVKVKGTPVSRAEAPIFVVAPHSTFFDGFVVFWIDEVPFIVNRTENRKIPIFGKCIEVVQAVFVSREVANSRQKTIKEIIRRSCSEDWSQLVIFPEGSTSNRSALMSFKRGAFIPGKPVQPILIKYPNKTDTVTWTWDQPHGVKSIAWLTMTQFFSRAELEFLPVYTPNEDEINDPILYAQNVREIMANALGVPLCDESYEDAKTKYAHMYKTKKKNQ